jgi:hypothetical protein
VDVILVRPIIYEWIIHCIHGLLYPWIIHSYKNFPRDILAMFC